MRLDDIMDIKNDKELALGMLKEYSELINRAIQDKYSGTADMDECSKKLYESQLYSLSAGGKRIRPSLTLEVCNVLGGDIEAAMPFALAIEMVHTYSLIHDDLPCMDDDDMRRGKPSNHKVFGEAYATLAGDGLLTDAFFECAMNPHVSGDCAAAACGILASAAGSFGMVKGQAMDMYGEEHKLPIEDLISLHLGKTGALICASVQLGAIAAGVEPNDERMEKLTSYAQKIGLVFQIIDDMLDATSTSEEMGKGVRSDGDKTTFMTYFTPSQALECAERYTQEAIEAIDGFYGCDRLRALARYLCYRKR